MNKIEMQDVVTATVGLSVIDNDNEYWEGEVTIKDGLIIQVQMNTDTTVVQAHGYRFKTYGAKGTTGRINIDMLIAAMKYAVWLECESPCSPFPVDKS